MKIALVEVCTLWNATKEQILEEWFLFKCVLLDGYMSLLVR